MACFVAGRGESLSSARLAGMISGLVLGLFTFIAAPASAQNYTLGGDARSFAMGGAGIALLQPSMGSRINPASLAFERRDVNPVFPSLGLRSNNVDVNAASYLINGMKSAEGVGLLQNYAARDSDFGVNGNAALRFGKIEISGNAVGVGRLQPNATLQAWGQTGNRDLNKLGLDARGDVYAAGYYTLPALAMATTLPAPKRSLNNVALGLRVKNMRAVYSHYIADYDSLIGRGDALRAPEMDGKDTLEKSGIGADLGIMIHPRNGLGFSSAFVVSNAVKPNFVFNGTDRNNQPVRHDLLETNMMAGVGYTTRKTMFAADVINLNGNPGGMQYRVGAEHRVLRTLALRAGFSSRTGATYGFSFFGFDAAFGSKVPLEVVRTINF